MKKTLEIGNQMDLDTKLNIRANSGGERGVKDSGQKFDYTVRKKTFLLLVGEVFDKEVEASDKENAKSGGAVSQFLHSYGATADKMEKSGQNPFPAEGGEFDDNSVATWLEVMEYRAERKGGKRKSAKEVKMDTAIALLGLPGMTWDMIKAGFEDVTMEEIEAYKAKLATPAET